MCSRIILLFALLFISAPVTFGQQDDRQSAIVLDEDLWVTFYDLPSRRFRAIRTAILTVDHEAAARDLALAANYLSVEAGRSSAVYQAPLNDVVSNLRQMQERVDTLTLAELDVLFGRAHWLLAQHYLAFARDARDARNGRNTSLYLWATTHHVERAILWSDAAVTREVHATLQNLRKLASDLADPETSARAYRERPVVRAENLLAKIGKQINRRVLPPSPQSDNPDPESQ